ncbi:MAG: hypothetical protein ACLTDA_11045 [[Eubacterium] siraeum]
MADPLKFYLITDLHHYAPSLGTSGKAYEKWNNKEQKCLETGAIIDAAFSKLIADKDIDIVLIAGDLTSTGAMKVISICCPSRKGSVTPGNRCIL